MRRYETIAILDPDLSEDQRTAAFARVQELIPQQGGLLAFIDEWGARKLAYEIKKRERGYYVRFDYCGTSAVVDEMERFFRIDEGVLKYMTVLTDTDPDLDSIHEEIAKAEAEKAISAEGGATEASEPLATEPPPDDQRLASESPETKTPADEATRISEPPETKTPEDDSPHASEPLQTETAEDDPKHASQPAETETIDDDSPPLESKEEKE